MGGEKKAFIFLCMLTMIGITVIYSLLFISLWQYRMWVGFSLLFLLILLVLVFVRGQLVEQHLRQVRYHHNEETPLEMNEEPLYGRQEMPEDPYRMPMQMRYPSQDRDWE
jgi:hypothetical protein